MKLGRLLAAGLFLLVVDRTIKWLGVKTPGTSGGFFYLGYELNPNALFSLPLPEWLVVFSGLITMGLILWLAISAWKKNNVKLLIALGLIIIGGAGNLFDRLVYGGVIDIFQTTIGLSFNLSDLYIVLGVILIGLFYVS